MLYVYLAYGLSFVIMGFAMAFQSFSYFRVLPRVPLLLLAGFGITHGMFELQRMLQIIEMRGIANASPVPIDYASMFLLPISFMFLFAFAIELLIHEEFIARYWRASYFLAPLLLGSLVIFPAWSKFQTVGDWPLRLEVATRYFLAFPSGTLSSYALLKIAGRIPVHERFRFKVAMYASAVVLLIYGIVAGLLVFNPTGFEGFPEHGISTAPSSERDKVSCRKPKNWAGEASGCKSEFPAMDKVLHASIGRLTGGISPVALSLAYTDWISASHCVAGQAARACPRGRG